jgi:hypothetical protein
MTSATEHQLSITEWGTDHCLVGSKQRRVWLFAASCLTAIEIFPAQVPMAGTYKLYPDITARRAAPRNPFRAMRHRRHRRAQILTRANVKIATLKHIASSAKGECARNAGRITDPELRQSGLATFNQDEAYMAASSPVRRHRSEADQ